MSEILFEILVFSNALLKLLSSFWICPPSFHELTLQKFYRINGGSTQLRGVVPDIIIPDQYEYLKYREKDNPDALPWDEIQKATYNQSKLYYDPNVVKSAAENRVNTSPSFVTIKETSQALAKINDKEDKDVVNGKTNPKNEVAARHIYISMMIVETNCSHSATSLDTDLVKFVTIFIFIDPFSYKKSLLKLTFPI